MKPLKEALVHKHMDRNLIDILQTGDIIEPANHERRSEESVFIYIDPKDYDQIIKVYNSYIDNYKYTAPFELNGRPFPSKERLEDWDHGVAISLFKQEDDDSYGGVYNSWHFLNPDNYDINGYRKGSKGYKKVDVYRTEYGFEDIVNHWGNQNCYNSVTYRNQKPQKIV